MKITHIQIKNYKSIKNVSIKCSPKINAFIGENSVGKSNIFDAINWPLGTVYPSFNSTLPQDHFMGDVDNIIDIKLNFDDGKYLQLTEEWIDSRSNTKSGLNLSNNYVQDTDRQKYCSAYLGVDRAIVDYLPTNRWSLMGRLLLEFNTLFKNETVIIPGSSSTIPKPEHLKNELKKIRDNVLFTVKDQHGNEVMKEFIEILKKESAKQLNRPESEFSIDMNLYDPWNFFRTLQLLVTESDTNLSFQVSNLGMGVQASISIAILKAYSKLKLNNNTPLFIDEPELFLHPQAQRSFYKLLIELADNGTQIFLTTHSPNFLDVGRFDEINLVRKSGEDGTFIRNAKLGDFVVDLKERTRIESTEDDIKLHFKNAYENTGDSQKANEAFFAKKIILVEGQSESLIIPFLFNLYGYDYLSKSISIVRVGGKEELDRFYRLYTEFGIPCYIIFDGDGNHKGTKDEEETKRRNKSILSLFGESLDFPDGQIHDKYFGFDTKIEDHLGFEVSSSIKGLELYKLVKTSLTRTNIPGWVEGVTQKIDGLQDNVLSVLRKPSA